MQACAVGYALFNHLETAVNQVFSWWTSLYSPGKDGIENTASSIVASLSVASNMFLPHRCLTPATFLSSTIPSFSRHVTVFYLSIYLSTALHFFCFILAAFQFLNPMHSR
jgi:hypothetical protein